MMKALGVIPARGGSKGIPLKNIHPLNGTPLILYTIQAAQKSQSLAKVIVSTDNTQIAEFSHQHHVEVPFVRPKELSTDTAGPIPVLQHALHEMEKKDNTQYDIIVMLQPTTPFRTAEDIDQSIQKIIKTKADSVISVVSVGALHPARMKTIKGDQLIDPPFCEKIENQRRQELEPMFIRNGAIYVVKRNILLSNSLKGKDSRAWIMPKERSINIDTLEDFKYAEWILKNENTSHRV